MRRNYIQPSREQGISLLIVLVLLIASVFLGVSAGVIALQSEKAARIDRDRQIAFQAAEAALIDAQRDIDTPLASSLRPLEFSPKSMAGFPSNDTQENCYSHSNPAGFGLCREALATDTPTWLKVDLTNTGADAVSVPYGTFTGQVFPFGTGALPARLPRYVIERMQYKQGGMAADSPSSFYRITAIGFGSNSKTQVVLQTLYRKEE